MLVFTEAAVTNSLDPRDAYYRVYRQATGWDGSEKLLENQNYSEPTSDTQVVMNSSGVAMVSWRQLTGRDSVANSRLSFGPDAGMGLGGKAKVNSLATIRKTTLFLPETPEPLRSMSKAKQSFCTHKRTGPDTTTPSSATMMARNGRPQTTEIRTS